MGTLVNVFKNRSYSIFLIFFFIELSFIIHSTTNPCWIKWVVLIFLL